MKEIGLVKGVVIIVGLIILTSNTASAQYLKVDTTVTMDIEELIPSSKLSFGTMPKLHIADQLLHPGIMCRLENRQDANKNKNLTYRMRLGNLDYVNRLEGKYNYNQN